MISALQSTLILGLALACTQCAPGKDGDKRIEHASGYIEESPLPAGYPEPGPFDQVSRKSYPAYRAAVTTSGQPNSGFWTLFRHIQRKDIAMTSPVEMKMGENQQGELAMEEMSFLYRRPDQGQAGPDGNQIKVVDLPAIEVLSYAWQGPRSDDAIAKAKALLLAEAEKRKLKTTGFRLLGYNSPFIDDARKTHELQLMLK